VRIQTSGRIKDSNAASIDLGKTARAVKQGGTVSGYDFAGVVEELGSGAEATRRVGERVTTFVPGGIRLHYHKQNLRRLNPPISGRSLNGAYAEYVVTKADVCMTIPDSWSFEDAAQLPIAVLTTCQCLYQSLRLPPLP